jgi:hypothetical protein
MELTTLAVSLGSAVLGYIFHILLSNRKIDRYSENVLMSENDKLSAKIHTLERQLNQCHRSNAVLKAKVMEIAGFIRGFRIYLEAQGFKELPTFDFFSNQSKDGFLGGN